MAEPRQIDLTELRPRLERAFDFAARQVRATIERDPNLFPIYTTKGRWKHRGESWTEWCAGFHTGMMWLIAERTQRPMVAETGRDIIRGCSSTGSTTAMFTTSGSSF